MYLNKLIIYIKTFTIHYFSHLLLLCNADFSNPFMSVSHTDNIQKQDFLNDLCFPNTGMQLLAAAYKKKKS